MRRCARGGQARHDEWDVLFDAIIGLGKRSHCRSIRLCEAVLECCNELGEVLASARTSSDNGEAVRDLMSISICYLRTALVPITTCA